MNDEQKPNIPEVVDPRDLPQYKEYEAQQVAKSHLDLNEQPVTEQPTPAQEPVSPMVADNPAVKFSGPVEEPVTEPVAEPVVEAPTPEPAPEQPAEVPAQDGKKDRLVGLFAALLAVLMVLAMAFVGFLFLPTGESFLANIGGVAVRTTLISVLLGVFALIALPGMIIGFLKINNAAKTDVAKKKRGFALTAISGFALLVSVVGFIVISFAGGGGEPQQRLEDYIITDPAELKNLTAPVGVAFDATGLPIDTSQFEVISYQWTFGDGDKATGDKVTHTFTRKPDEAFYDVNLTVVYKDIATNEQKRLTITKQVGIVNQQALISFTIEPDFGAAPLTVKVDASETLDTDGDVVIEWDFDGDDLPDEEGVTAEYTYEENGTYQVTIIVTDTNGQVTTDSKEVVVDDDGGFGLNYELTPDDDPLIPGIGYQFDASNTTAPSGRIIDYAWRFSDGSQPKRGQKITHSFNNEGIYTVTLEVSTDDNKSFSKDFSVQVGDVLSGPQVEITSVPPMDEQNNIRGNAPLSVSFTAEPLRGPERERIVEYNWDFDGDGQTDAQGTSARYVFEEPGIANVELMVIDADGEENVFPISVQIGERGVQARLTATPIAGELPLNVDFDASSSTTDESDPIVTFIWDFGDGTGQRRDNAQLTYTYKQVGSYTARVQAVTASGKTSQAQILINVNPVSLKACFNPSRKVGTAPVIVEFSPRCSQGVIGSYQWSFGDGDESIERQPVHTFTEPGTYTVTLTVENNNITDVFMDTIVVE